MSGIEIPSDLLCPLCKGLIAEAVLLPCCALDACEECARAELEKTGGKCPLEGCRDKASPDDLIPNRMLRSLASKFRSDHPGLIKSATKRSLPVAAEAPPLELSPPAPAPVFDSRIFIRPVSEEKDVSVDGDGLTEASKHISKNESHLPKDADKSSSKLVEKPISGKELFKLVERDDTHQVEKSTESLILQSLQSDSASQHEPSPPALTPTTFSPPPNSSKEKAEPMSRSKSPNEIPPLKSNSLNNPDSLWDIHSGLDGNLEQQLISNIEAEVEKEMMETQITKSETGENENIDESLTKIQVLKNLASDDNTKQHDPPSSEKATSPPSPSSSENAPESGTTEPQTTKSPKIESNHAESSSGEPPVPGEEKNSNHPAQNPSIHLTHHDHTFEIPSQLLDEARNDPLAAFNKLMAVRDKEKGIDPLTYYAPPAMQLVPTVMPPMQYPPNLYYPPPPFYPQQSTDAYRHQQQAYQGARPTYPGYHDRSRMDRSSNHYRDAKDYPRAYRDSERYYPRDRESRSYRRDDEHYRSSKRSSSPQGFKGDRKTSVDDKKASKDRKKTSKDDKKKRSGSESDTSSSSSSSSDSSSSTSSSSSSSEESENEDEKENKKVENKKERKKEKVKKAKTERKTKTNGNETENDQEDDERRRREKKKVDVDSRDSRKRRSKSRRRSSSRHRSSTKTVERHRKHSSDDDRERRSRKDREWGSSRAEKSKRDESSAERKKSRRRRSDSDSTVVSRSEKKKKRESDEEEEESSSRSKTERKKRRAERSNEREFESRREKSKSKERRRKDRETSASETEAVSKSKRGDKKRRSRSRSRSRRVESSRGRHHSSESDKVESFRREKERASRRDESRERRHDGKSRDDSSKKNRDRQRSGSTRLEEKRALRSRSRSKSRRSRKEEEGLAGNDKPVRTKNKDIEAEEIPSKTIVLKNQIDESCNKMSDSCKKPTEAGDTSQSPRLSAGDKEASKNIENVSASQSIEPTQIVTTPSKKKEAKVWEEIPKKKVSSHSSAQPDPVTPSGGGNRISFKIKRDAKSQESPTKKPARSSSRAGKEEEVSSKNFITESQIDLETKIAESIKSKWDTELVEEDDNPVAVPEIVVAMPVVDVRRFSEDELLKKREKWRTDQLKNPSLRISRQKSSSPSHSKKDDSPESDKPIKLETDKHVHSGVDDGRVANVDNGESKDHDESSLTLNKKDTSQNNIEIPVSLPTCPSSESPKRQSRVDSVEKDGDKSKSPKHQSPAKKSTHYTDELESQQEIGSVKGLDNEIIVDNIADKPVAVKSPKRHQSASPQRKSENDDSKRERKSRKIPEKLGAVASDDTKEAKVASPTRKSSKTPVAESPVKTKSREESKVKRRRSSSDSDREPKKSDKSRKELKEGSRKRSSVTEKSKKLRDSSAKEKKKKNLDKEDSEEDSSKVQKSRNRKRKSVDKKKKEKNRRRKSKSKSKRRRRRHSTSESDDSDESSTDDSSSSSEESSDSSSSSSTESSSSEEDRKRKKKKKKAGAARSKKLSKVTKKKKKGKKSKKEDSSGSEDEDETESKSKLKTKTKSLPKPEVHPSKVSGTNKSSRKSSSERVQTHGDLKKIEDAENDTLADLCPQTFKDSNKNLPEQVKTQVQPEREGTDKDKVVDLSPSLISKGSQKTLQERVETQVRHEGKDTNKDNIKDLTPSPSSRSQKISQEQSEIQVRLEREDTIKDKIVNLSPSPPSSKESHKASPAQAETQVRPETDNTNKDKASSLKSQELEIVADTQEAAIIDNNISLDQAESPKDKPVCEGDLVEAHTFKQPFSDSKEPTSVAIQEEPIPDIKQNIQLAIRKDSIQVQEPTNETMPTNISPVKKLDEAEMPSSMTQIEGLTSKSEQKNESEKCSKQRPTESPRHSQDKTPRKQSSSNNGQKRRGRSPSPENPKSGKPEDAKEKKKGSDKSPSRKKNKNGSESDNSDSAKKLSKRRKSTSPVMKKKERERESRSPDKKKKDKKRESRSPDRKKDKKESRPSSKKEQSLSPKKRSARSRSREKKSEASRLSKNKSSEKSIASDRTNKKQRESSRSPDRRRRRHSSGESHHKRHESPEITKRNRNKSPEIAKRSRNETSGVNKSPTRKKPRASSSADSQDEEDVKQDLTVQLLEEIRRTNLILASKLKTVNVDTGSSAKVEANMRMGKMEERRKSSSSLISNDKAASCNDDKEKIKRTDGKQRHSDDKNGNEKRNKNEKDRKRNVSESSSDDKPKRKQRKDEEKDKREQNRSKERSSRRHRSSSVEDSKPKESSRTHDRKRRERESVDSSRSDGTYAEKNRSKAKEAGVKKSSNEDKISDPSKIVPKDDSPIKASREDSPKKSKSKRKIIVKNEPLGVKLRLSQDSSDEQSDQDDSSSSKRTAGKPFSGQKEKKAGRSYRPQRSGLFSYADLVAKRSEEDEDLDEVRQEALLQKRLQGRSSSTTIDLNAIQVKVKFSTKTKKKGSHRSQSSSSSRSPSPPSQTTSTRTKTPEENNGKAVTKRDDEIETDIPKFFVEKRTRKISRRPSEEIEEGEYSSETDTDAESPKSNITQNSPKLSEEFTSVEKSLKIIESTHFESENSSKTVESKVLTDNPERAEDAQLVHVDESAFMLEIIDTTKSEINE